MARKAAEKFAQHYLLPMKGGSGVKPTWIDIPDYKGIPLTADVAQRMAAYRAYPSVQEQTRWIVGGV